MYRIQEYLRLPQGREFCRDTSLRRSEGGIPSPRQEESDNKFPTAL